MIFNHPELIRMGSTKALPYGTYHALSAPEKAAFHGRPAIRPAPAQPSAVAIRRDNPAARRRPAHSTIRPPEMRPTSPPLALAAGTQVTAAPAAKPSIPAGQRLMAIAVTISREREMTLGRAFAVAADENPHLWAEHQEAVSQKGRA